MPVEYLSIAVPPLAHPPAGLKAVLLFTFILHLIPVNLLVGGSILAAIGCTAGGRNARYASCADTLLSLIPSVVRMTVLAVIVSLSAVGIAYSGTVPLSALLSSRVWLISVVLLVAGYIGTHYVRGRHERGTRSSVVPAWIVAVLFTVFGLFYSVNFSLLLRPESWSRSLSSGVHGFPVWSNPVLYPGFLHMLLGAVAVSGLWVMILGTRERQNNAEKARWTVDFGGKMFLHATLVNIVIGIWFLLALPREVLKQFVGASMAATHSLISAFLLTAAALFIIFRARYTENSTRLIYTGTGIMLAVLVLMALMRQQF